MSPFYYYINEVDSLKIKLDLVIQTNKVLEASPGRSATTNDTEQVDTLLKEINDVMNRSMRSTLVFKNIEQKGDKTWEEPNFSLMNCLISSKINLQMKEM